MQRLEPRQTVLSSCKVLNFAAKFLYYISYRICNHLWWQKALFINVTAITRKVSAYRDAVWSKEACVEPVIGTLPLKSAR